MKFQFESLNAWMSEGIKHLSGIPINDVIKNLPIREHKMYSQIKKYLEAKDIQVSVITKGYTGLCFNVEH